MELPEVSSPLGAPMGRVEHIGDTQAHVRLSLQVLPVNPGGYDKGGAYWGHSTRGLGPIYWACSFDLSIQRFFRAPDRRLAKSKVLRWYPNATFFR